MCLTVNRRFVPLPEHPEQSEPQSGVQREREQDDESELDTVGEHQRQHQHRHETVDQARDQSLREHVADGLDGAEARQDVADVPLFEKGEWQTHQMMKQPRADLKAQRVLQDKNNERAGRGRRNFDQEQERESKPKYEQEIDVPSGDDLVNRELHVERGGEDKNLDDH